MSKEEALKYGAVGPTARASGVDYDVRRDDPYLAYAEVPWKVVTDNHGDVYGRTRVRIGELLESARIVRSCLENIPSGPVRVEAPKNAPKGEILSRYEAPRGSWPITSGRTARTKSNGLISARRHLRTGPPWQCALSTRTWQIYR